MQNLKVFTRPRLLQKTPEHTLGLEMTDQEYLDSVPDKRDQRFDVDFDIPDNFLPELYLASLESYQE